MVSTISSPSAATALRKSSSVIGSGIDAAGCCVGTIGPPNGRAVNLSRCAGEVYLPVSRTRQRSYFLQQRVGGDLSAVASVVAQRPCVAFGSEGGAGVGGDRHQVAEIARVAHRRVNALVG